MPDFDPFMQVRKLEEDLRRVRSDRDIWKQTATSFENSANTLERHRDAARASITLLQEALSEAADALHEGNDGGTRKESIADRIRAVQLERDDLRER